MNNYPSHLVSLISVAITVGNVNLLISATVLTTLTLYCILYSDRSLHKLCNISIY